MSQCNNNNNNKSIDNKPWTLLCRNRVACTDRSLSSLPSSCG